MIRTSFLPSDDSPRLPYHIPGNAFAVVELNRTAMMLQILVKTTPAPNSLRLRMLKVADAAFRLSASIDEGIHRYGVMYHAMTGEKVYAMEVDGYGNSFFGDDANVPSLLGLPYLEYTTVDDPIYLSTRRLLLSNHTNPYFYGDGDVGAPVLGGIGSEDASGNAGLGHVWPLSLAIRLMTIDDTTPQKEISARQEAEWILNGFVDSSGGTGLMHESFWYEDPAVYTRYWFAMANSLFSEALLLIVERHPEWVFAQ